MPCSPGIATMSLGRANLHDLEHKLDQAQSHGFKGIELFFDDLEAYAKCHPEILEHGNSEYDSDSGYESYTPTTNGETSSINGDAEGVSGHSYADGTSYAVNGYLSAVNAASSGINGRSHINGLCPTDNSPKPPFQGSLNLSLPSSVVIAAARAIKTLCDARGLAVISLQPFRHFEGLLSREEHARRIAEFKVWIACASALHTTMIGIPSTFLPAAELHDDIAIHIADLTEAADLAAAADPPIRLVYESLAWGTHTDTWEASWATVRAVDRPNFGIVLDTFNIAARAYADPATPSGTLSDDPHAAAAALAGSLARLVSDVDLAKVFYIQVADGERLAAPLLPGHEFHADGQPPRMSWSRNCRLFYAEAARGAYLPVRDILGTLLAPRPHGLGFGGWISFEVFSRSLADPRAECAAEHAARGAESWAAITRDFGACVEA